MSDVQQNSAHSSMCGSLSRRLLLTASTAASLFGIYLLYTLAVSPVIATESVGHGRVYDFSSIQSGRNKYKDLARTYLNEYEWTIEANYKIGTGQNKKGDSEAFLYFQDWERGDSDVNFNMGSTQDKAEASKAMRTVHFKPFAMIWMPKGHKPGETPFTIYCDSAYVEFAREFKFPNPQPGRVIKGVLQGVVRIRGANNLTLKSRNFHFAEKAMQIWCDTKVHFTHQKNSGIADGMTIDLIRDDEARRKDKFSASGIKLVTLMKNVSMNLVSVPEEDQHNARTDDEGNSKSREPVDVNIQSAGSFVFSVQTNIATFEKEVRVRSHKRSEPENIDQLLCDLLTLVFSRDENKTNDVAKTNPSDENAPVEQNDRFRGLGNDLTFQRLSADGRNVTLLSIANELTVSMTRLIYDAESKIAEMTSKKMVQVLQKSSEMRAPLVEIRHNDDGDVTHLTCLGAGGLKNVDPDTLEILLTAQWSDKMHKYPDPEPGSKLDIIELEKQALVRQPVEKMRLAAEFIRLWFDRENEQQQQQQQHPQQPDRRSLGQANGIHPKRLFAEKNVTMISPEMNAEGRRLEVWFEEGHPVAPARKNRIGFYNNPPQMPGAFDFRLGRDRRQPQLRHSLIETASRRPRIRPRTSRARLGTTVIGQQRGPTQIDTKLAIPPLRSNTTKAQRQKVDEPMQVRADLIRVLVLQVPGEEDPRVSEVWAKGHVDVKQYRQDAEKPLHLTGEVMHIINHNETEQEMHLEGMPAHVRNAQMHIEGNNVYLDRVGNFARVEGKGLLELPVKQDLEGNPLPKPELLSIWWDERMTFDGKLARFLENVRTNLQDSEMRCAEMQAVMDRRYSFTEDQLGGENEIKIHRVYCTGSVEFESRRYEGRKLVEFRQGEFDELSLNQKSGDMTAQGPGHILSWSRGQGRRAGLIPTAKVQANKGSDRNDSEWDYTRIEFAGIMRGNTNRQSTTFHDRTQVTYGPVERPHETIDPDVGLPEGGGWMRCEELQVTQRKKPGFEDGYVELLGRGNVELEGRDFSAQSDEVAYDESKGKYDLRGKGNRVATIWQQTVVGGSRSSESAKRIEFIPALNQTKISGSTGGVANE